MADDTVPFPPLRFQQERIAAALDRGEEEADAIASASPEVLRYVERALEILEDKAHHHREEITEHMALPAMDLLRAARKSGAALLGDHWDDSIESILMVARWIVEFSFSNTPCHGCIAGERHPGHFYSDLAHDEEKE